PGPARHGFRRRRLVVALAGAARRRRLVVALAGAARRRRLPAGSWGSGSGGSGSPVAPRARGEVTRMAPRRAVVGGGVVPGLSEAALYRLIGFSLPAVRCARA